MLNRDQQIEQQLKIILPEEARTISGVPYSPDDDHWYIKTRKYNVHFHFDKMRNDLHPDILNCSKMVIKHFLDTLSEGTVSASYIVFKDFIHFSKSSRNRDVVTEVSLSDVLNYFDHKKDSPHAKTTLRAFLKKWNSLGYPGINSDAVEYLNRAKIKMKRKNLIVLTADPLRGAYTNQEYHALLDEIDKVFQEGSVTLEQYVIASLFNYFGFRPEQLAQMKTKDFVVELSDTGGSEISTA